MAEAVVSVVLSTLKDLLLQETRFLRGVSVEVKGLESQLKEMHCILKDADKRRHESDSVQHWLSEIRDLAYRAEDIVETYSVQISSRRSTKGVIRMLLKRFSCILKEYATLHQMGSQILNIKSEMERVRKSMQEYGIKEIIQGERSVEAFSENQQWIRQTYPFDKIDECFVGMEDDVKKLVSLVVDDKQHRVVSILGMGGLGKTTIARKVYNDEETKRSFQSFAWICVTQQCQIRSVLEDILKQLSIEEIDVKNISNTELIQQLCQIQRSKRCLIVLDDVWKTDDWDALKSAFLAADIKNKILLTTRKENIAAFGFAHKLGFLKEDDAWELLKKKAFNQKDVSVAVEPWVEEVLQKIGKKMVRKCGYLPLGISLLGGILSTRKSLEEWELVNENLKGYLYKIEGIGHDNNEISSVVDLSYEDLPSYLKPCFLYMGHYKEDELINAQRLYQLWVAEGLISHKRQGKEDTLLDVAELYLSELVSRCIVQVQEVDDVKLGKVYITCKLHDIVRELCLLKGKTEDFRLRLLHCEGGQLSVSNPTSCPSSDTRRLAINFLEEKNITLKNGIASSFQQQIINKNIRSLQFRNGIFGHRYKIEFPRNVLEIWKLKLLRVLVFENFKFGGKFPRQIGNLINLRNLTLRFCSLDELPISIRNLTHLCTLDLGGSKDVLVPNVLKNMRHIKHLHFPNYINRRHNYRLSLEGLDELEILEGFDSLVHDVKSITKMKNLHEFMANIYDNKTLYEVMHCINSNWNNLRICRLRIREGCDLESSTEDGSSIFKKLMACSNLHSVSIRVLMRNLLGAFDPCKTTHVIFPRLVRLDLSECKIEDIDPMTALGKLPYLKYLGLWERSYVGEVMICEARGFPRLEQLGIHVLPNLREWKVEEGAMPKLSILSISHCYNLEMIPDGLKFVTTLNKLNIAGIPELRRRVSAILEDGREGEDYYKVRHVPSIIL